jgi:hypothetical protein
MRTLKRLLLATALTTALATACTAPAGAIFVRPVGQPFTMSGSISLTMRGFPFIPIYCTTTGRGLIPGPSVNNGAPNSVTTPIAVSVVCGAAGSTLVSTTGGTWTVTWALVGRRLAWLTLPDSAITQYIGGCAFIMDVAQPVTLTGLYGGGNLYLMDQQLDMSFAGCGSMRPGPYMLVRGTLAFSSGGTTVDIT